MSAPVAPPLTAGCIMTRDISTVAADASLGAAVRLMLDQHVSGLPVLDKAGMLAGILTEGDLLRRVELGTEEHRSGWRALILGPQHKAADFVATHSRVVRDVMTAPVLTVDVAASLAEVVSIMQAKHVKRVPVMAGHTLMGIVSRSDLLRRLADSFPDAPADVPSDATIREDVLAALGQQSWGSRGGINVAVVDGMVDLEGVIFEEAERTALRVTIQNVPGVMSVRDHLKWVPPN